MLAWINVILLLIISGIVSATILTIKLAYGFLVGATALIVGVTVTFVLSTYALFSSILDYVASRKSK